MILKDWMKRKKLTQKKLADVLGISQSHLSRICTGSTIPEQRLAERISAITNGEISVAMIRQIREPFMPLQKDLDIEVLDFKKELNVFHNGIVWVRYGDMKLRCELICGKVSFWIKMPQTYDKEGEPVKMNTCSWLTKEKSDEFQRTVLKQLEAYPEAFIKTTKEEWLEIKKRYKGRAKAKKQQIKEEPVIKARPVSKFQKSFTGNYRTLTK